MLSTGLDIPNATAMRKVEYFGTTMGNEIGIQRRTLRYLLQCDAKELQLVRGCLVMSAVLSIMAVFLRSTVSALVHRSR